MSWQLDDIGCTEDKHNFWMQIRNPQLKGRGLIRNDIASGFEEPYYYVRCMPCRRRHCKRNYCNASSSVAPMFFIVGGSASWSSRSNVEQMALLWFRTYISKLCPSPSVAWKSPSPYPFAHIGQTSLIARLGRRTSNFEQYHTTKSKHQICHHNVQAFCLITRLSASASSRRAPAPVKHFRTKSTEMSLRSVDSEKCHPSFHYVRSIVPFHISRAILSSISRQVQCDSRQTATAPLLPSLS